MLFKVGDKVRIISVAKGASQGKLYDIGKTYIIDYVYNDNRRWPYCLVYNSYSWCDEEIELVQDFLNQVCASCKITCPHEKPNQKDETYVCIACIITKQLSE